MTAPLLTMGVGIDATAPEVALPATEAGPATPEQSLLNITVDAEGRIFLEGTEIGFGDLAPKLTAIRETFSRPGLGPQRQGDALRRGGRGAGQDQGGGFARDLHH